MGFWNWLKGKTREEKFADEGLSWDELTDEEKQEFQKISDEHNSKQALAFLKAVQKRGYEKGEKTWGLELTETNKNIAKFFKRNNSLFYFLLGESKTETYPICL